MTSPDWADWPKPALHMSDVSEQRLRRAVQLGAVGINVQGEAMGPAGTLEILELSETPDPTADFERLRGNVEAQGLEVLCLQLPAQATNGVLTGGERRDREIQHLTAVIRAAGKAGIPTVFYNLTPWRSTPVWWHGNPGVPELGSDDVRHGSGPGRYYRRAGRGGTVLNTHETRRVEEDEERTPPETLAPYGEIDAQTLWERVRYLYERIIPVAEEAGVNVGAHPNDPPEPRFRGVEQIHNTPQGLQQLIDLIPSERSGLLLCIGTLHEMGTGPEDTMTALESFLKQKRVFGTHFRNPKGTVPQGYYQEDFLDDGDLDMLEVVRLMRKHGYTGGMDPDHAQGIEGDERAREAWAWQLGYIRALVRAVRSEERS
ncbi:MAG TPA: mannonate dehydratase [Chloroflexota bacterium]|nr:mannonate dehydratase [Chloroflexota bacterium]